MANKFTGITSAGVNVPVYDKEAHQALGNVYTKSEVDTELNTKQDNLSTEQLYNIDHALTTSAGLASEAWVNDQGFAKESDIPTTAGLMEESKLGIESNHITAYNGIPFSAEGGGSSDIVYFDYNSGDPELSWAEIKTYMDNGKELIIYDRTAIEDGRTKMGYVSNYDKANNFIQFNNVSNATSAGKAITGINWAYLGNNLGWQRTGAQGGGGKTYEGVAPIVVDNTNDQISVSNKELFVQRPLNIAYDENENPVIQAETVDVNYQQIVHDDSLVHVSNNAQYALGVNTRMFRDETVLFSGSNTNTCTLSEPLTNFECVKIYVSHDPNTIPMCCNEYDITKTTQNLHVRWHAGTGNMYDYFAYISVNDKNLVVEKTLERRTTWAASPTLTYAVDTRKNCICKVVGIGRKGGV